MKVLLVHPGGAPAELVAALARRGHGVRVASDALTAMDLMEHVRVDAVVTEYRLDGRSGVWLLQHVKESAPAALRVLITDDNRIQLQKIATAGICHAYLRRPYPVEALSDLLRGVPAVVVTDYTPVAGF